MKAWITKTLLRKINQYNRRYTDLPLDERSPSYLQPIINLRLRVWVKGS